MQTINERRLWIDAGDLKHSGKPDRIVINGDTALMVDWKTGRNEAMVSPRNFQLRDLAVLVAANFGVRRVHVALIQPWVTMQPEVCTYELEDLLSAQRLLEQRIRASNNPNSPRLPGDRQCQYCRAKAQCPEFLAGSLPVKPEAAAPEPVKAGIENLSNDRLGAFLAIVRLAEETATAEVRRRVEAGEAVNGWILKPGRETEKITDAQTVFNRALAAGITQQSFVADCITVGKTALKTALKTAPGAKGKALDAKLDELLAGATETKTSNPVLTKA
ncbi:MAG: DUF2800 domain-containing protein [Patescibacteria group bacterium]|nr:DUF2800 domain-containing protein [Patescibacteria group bacterium]